MTGEERKKNNNEDDYRTRKTILIIHPASILYHFTHILKLFEFLNGDGELKKKRKII